MTRHATRRDCKSAVISRITGAARLCGNDADADDFLGFPFCRQHRQQLEDAIVFAFRTPRGNQLAGLWHEVRGAVLEAKREADEMDRNELERSSRARSLIYYVERDGYIKIGTTCNLRKRLNDLSKGGTSAPAGMTIGPVSLLATHTGDRQKERELHSRFASDRIVGEWFHKSDPLMAHIASLPSAGPTSCRPIETSA